MKFEWKRIANEPPTYRAAVYGGWVLRAWDVDDCNRHTTSESMVFIPDPEHKWKIKEF